jgi:hydrogenase maturation factor
MDLYLSFPDEAAAKAVLYRIEGAVEATEDTEAVEGYEVPNYANIDTIGIIYKPTGETTMQDGMDVPVMAALPGWHANVRLAEGEDAEALEAFAVAPRKPMRVWG